MGASISKQSSHLSKPAGARKVCDDIGIREIVGFVQAIVSDTEDVDVRLARLMRTSPLISPPSANPRSLRAFLPRLFRNESTTPSG